MAGTSTWLVVVGEEYVPPRGTLATSLALSVTPGEARDWRAAEYGTPPSSSSDTSRRLLILCASAVQLAFVSWGQTNPFSVSQICPTTNEA